MRRGYTTGSCAAAAAKASMTAVLKEQFDDCAQIETPSGAVLKLTVTEKILKHRLAVCAVKKDSGDDPDVTNGTLIFAQVRLIDEPEFNEMKIVKGNVVLGNRFVLKGGKGIGTVTKPGLACGVGEPAINPTPRAMIEKAVAEAAEEYGYDGYGEVTVSIPDGEELAKKTFNPKLGIVGGISVLGTTGIVEPMSEQALVDTIEVEMKVCRAAGYKKVIITPGNYGKDFLKKATEIPEDMTVKCSNFIGEALHFAKEQDFEEIVLSGHLGKLIKVARGVLNTHSKYGDGRMQAMSYYSQKCGADKRLIEEIENCVVVDEAVNILENAGFKEAVMKLIVDDIVKTVKQTVEADKNKIKVGIIVFSNRYGLLGESENIGELL